MGTAGMTGSAPRGTAVARLADTRHLDAWHPTPDYSIAQDALFARSPADVAALNFGPSGPAPVSVGRIQEDAARCAGALRDRGVRPGDRVAMYLDPSVTAAVVVFGVLTAGAVLVPIPRLLGGAAVSYRLADSGAALLITDGPGLDRLTSTGGSPDQVPVLTTDGSHGPPLTEVLTGAQACAPVASQAEDPALLIYTSGTSGRPKGIVHAQTVLLGHSGVDYAFELFRPGDVYFGTADWGWVGGIMLGLLVPWAHRVPVVTHRARAFDPEDTLRLWTRCRVTTAFLPPSVLRMLRAHGRPAPSRLRAVVTGGEPASVAELGWARRNLADAVNKAYGQTEANGLIGDSAVLGSVDDDTLGMPYPGHRIALLDDSGHQVPPEEIGEIALALPDPAALLGYWDSTSQSVRPVEQTWHRTGDLGRATYGRRIEYHGRADDVIKTRGYRVGPAEVEAALKRHPAVLDAAVVGVPDPVMGQRVKAFLKLAPAGSLDQTLCEELAALVRSQVGAHAYPREFAAIDDLPHSETGKLLRRQLTEAQPGH